MDESCFSGRRKGNRDHGAAGKVPVSGILTGVKVCYAGLPIKPNAYANEKLHFHICSDGLEGFRMPAGIAFLFSDHECRGEECI
jgi:hypothetical protein